MMSEADIEEFWERNPCGESQVSRDPSAHESFFAAYDRLRYHRESHILPCLDRIDFKDKNTLEIGLGLGADSEQIIRRGAIWSGVDLTATSIERVQMRLRSRRLPYRELKQATVLALPFSDRSFDIVFSHGVLHHVPDIWRAQRELWRVLKPTGELIVMLYAKWSMNYLVSISLARRAGLAALYLTGYDPGGIYNEHLANTRRLGLRRYLSNDEWLHRNTDGPNNPYSKVYDLRTVRRDFPAFRVVRAYKQHMYAPPLAVGRLPLARLLGWHLWVHMAPKQDMQDKRA